MRNASFFVIASLILTLFSPIAWSLPQVDQGKTQEAMKLLETGKKEEGLALLKDIADRNPDDDGSQMNYGSVLFSKASFIFQSGDKGQGIKLLKETEPYFKAAIAIFEKDPKNKSLQSHCHYLLGDVYLYAYDNKDEARKNYEAALKLWPEHQGAQRQLSIVNGVAGPNATAVHGNVVFESGFDELRQEQTIEIINLTKRISTVINSVLNDPKVEIHLSVTDNLPKFVNSFYDTLGQKLPAALKYKEEFNEISKHILKHNGYTISLSLKPGTMRHYVVLQDYIYKDGSRSLFMILHELLHVVDITEDFMASRAPDVLKNREVKVYRQNIDMLHEAAQNDEIKKEFPKLNSFWLDLEKRILPEQEKSYEFWQNAK